MGGSGLHRKGKRKARKHRPQNTVMDRMEQSAKDRKIPFMSLDRSAGKDETKVTVVEPEGAGIHPMASKEQKGFLRKIFNRKTEG